MAFDRMEILDTHFHRNYKSHLPHIGVNIWVTIGLDNGLSPVRRQATT